jgi:hypothetical protein
MSPRRLEELAREAMPVGAAYAEDWEGIADVIRTAIREALDAAIAKIEPYEPMTAYWCVKRIRELRDELTGEPPK